MENLIKESDKFLGMINSHYGNSLKSLQILDCLSLAQGFIGITALCETTGLSAGTVHRILQEMVGAGYVSKDMEQKKYRIGLKAISMAMRIKSSDYITEIAHAEMQRLNELSSETVRLVTLDGDEGMHLAQLEAKNRVGLYTLVGLKVPLYCTGSGKSILAYFSKDRLYQYLLRVPLKRYTNKTLQNRDDFYKEMEQIAEQGYALDRGEYYPDIIVVAASIFTTEQTRECSIAVAAPSYRFTQEHAHALAPEVMRSANEISKLIQMHSQTSPCLSRNSE